MDGRGAVNQHRLARAPARLDSLERELVVLRKVVDHITQTQQRLAQSLLFLEPAGLRAVAYRIAIEALTEALTTEKDEPT